MHGHTHAQNGIIDSIRDTSSPQPDDKQVDVSSAILLLVCSHEVWVKVAYDWSAALCLCLCLCRPSFHS